MHSLDPEGENFERQVLWNTLVEEGKDKAQEVASDVQQKAEGNVHSERGCCLLKDFI